jgi:hypothetical protein
MLKDCRFCMPIGPKEKGASYETPLFTCATCVSIFEPNLSGIGENL